VTKTFVWIDGRIIDGAEARVPALDRGFLLGDGVFETMRGIGNYAVGLELHLNRLRLSAGTIGLEVPGTNDEISDAIAGTVKAGAFVESYIRLTVSRGPGAGLEPPPDVKPTMLITVQEHYSFGDAVVNLCISSIRRNENSPLSRIKSLNYLDSVLARMEARAAGFDEALLLNCSGLVACASAANIFAVIHGVVTTPPLSAGVLPGITRHQVFDICRSLGKRIAEQDITQQELAEASEIFITNSLTGIRPVVRLEDREVSLGEAGPITRSVRSVYLDLLRSGLL
jgi:branched-chain amino acid aminotransferase